jgi:hypothetical protein
MVEAVAAREPPNSARSGGKKTGNALVIPVTRSAEANARQEPPADEASRGLAHHQMRPDSRRRLTTPRETDRGAAVAVYVRRWRLPGTAALA